MPDGGNASYNQIGGPGTTESKSPISAPTNFSPGSWRNGTLPTLTSEGESGLQQTGPSGTTRG